MFCLDFSVYMFTHSRTSDVVSSFMLQKYRALLLRRYLFMFETIIVWCYRKMLNDIAGVSLDP